MARSSVAGGNRRIIAGNRSGRVMALGKGQSGGRREPVFDNSPELRVSTSDRSASSSKPSSPRRKLTRKPRKAKRRRSLLGRLIYWCLVLGLWAVIGGAGTIAYVGAHLPPIQSLEIPKRPPSIQINDVNGRALARRGDLAGEILSLKELPP